MREGLGSISAAGKYYIIIVLFCNKVNLRLSVYHDFVVLAGVYSVCVGNLGSRFSAKLVHFFLATYVIDNLRQRLNDIKQFGDEVNNVSVCIRFRYVQDYIVFCEHNGKRLLLLEIIYYYAPPLISGGIKRCFCLTSVCLTRTSGLTREQRGLGRLKLAQNLTHDSVTAFNVKRSKVRVTRPLYSPRP